MARLYIQEVDLIRVAMIASENRARREGWQLISAILVIGVLFIVGFVGRIG